jgi:hypothetical protein
MLGSAVRVLEAYKNKFLGSLVCFYLSYSANTGIMLSFCAPAPSYRSITLERKMGL